MFKPFIQSPNIWRHVSPIYFSPSQIIFPKKFSKIKFCVPLSNTIKHITPTINTQTKNKRKRGRRKLKSGEEYELALHTKDNDDNIKRKVKTHFHNFIVAYLNMLIRQTLKTKRIYKFKKMCSKITQDVTISYNKKLMDTPIKDVLVQVSNKFKDKDINLYYIEKIMQMKSNNEFENIGINTLKEILNTSYKDMMNNFYLKSNKKLFENEKLDESFETHIENLIIKYGYNYAIKFKQNAENFVQFYISSKQRNHKGINNSINNTQEKNQNYDNLKMSLNNNKSNILNLNEKVEKKFFEIIRDNTIGDVSKSITTLTMSQSDSCDGSSDREEKSFLNKKRKGIFDVVSSPEEKKEIK
jgi:hypothetical protein